MKYWRIYLALLWAGVLVLLIDDGIQWLWPVVAVGFIYCFFCLVYLAVKKIQERFL